MEHAEIKEMTIKSEFEHVQEELITKKIEEMTGVTGMHI